MRIFDKMRTRPFFLLSPLLVVCAVFGQAPSARAAGEAARELRIDPGTTSIPLGHARLSVDPLVRAPGKDGLSAAYKVDITPFTFKSEAGQFSVAISDADLQRLAGGATIHFTGQAVSQDGSNTSTVDGRATPAAEGGDGGALRIQVDGKKGKLVFHTTYHLTR